MATRLEIKNALDRADMRMSTMPEKATHTYQNRAIITGDTACMVTDGSFEMTFDVPAGMGGENAGPTPGTALRAGVSSCVAIGIKLWAAREGIDITYCEVRLEADSDARGQFALDEEIRPGYNRTRLCIEVRGDASDEAITAMINKSLKYSPLFDVFANEMDVSTNIRLRDAETAKAA